MIRSASLSRFRSSPEAGVFSGNEGIGSPLGLGNTAAWYDVSDLSSMRNDAGAIPATGEGIKLWADKSGNSSTNVLCLNGVAGNYASVPDPVEIGTLTALELIGAGRLPDWTPAAASTLVGKFDASGQLSFLLRITATNIFLEISNNGTATTAVSAGAANTLVDYSLGAIKATWRASDGRVQFFQSATWTSAASPGTWTQVGTDQTIAYASIFNSTSRLTIGAFDATGSSSPLTGNLHYASVADAIDGTPVISVNFTGFSKLSNGTASTGATVTINTSGATGARISGARDLYQGTAANQPILLQHSGTNYGYLNGVSGNVFTTPDAAFPTGDLELIFRATFADWTPGSNNYFGSKYDGGTQNTFYFALLTSGALRMGIDDTGASLVAFDSNAATGITNGDTAWIRVSVDVDNGAGGCSVNFYKAADQGSEPSSWTQIGTTVTIAGVQAFFNSTASLLFGGLTSSSGLMSGNLLRGIVKDGINGTITYDFNPALYASGTTFTASTGEVWTINGGATIVTKTSLYFDGSNDYLKAAAFALAQPETVYFVGSQVTWANADYLYDGNSLDSMGVRGITSTPQLSMEAGGSSANSNSGMAVGTVAVDTAVFNGASSLHRVNRAAAISGQNPGANNANGFSLGSRGNNTGGFANITAQEVAIYSVAHNTAQQDAIILYEGRKWGIAV